MSTPHDFPFLVRNKLRVLPKSLKFPIRPAIDTHGRSVLVCVVNIKMGLSQNIEKHSGMKAT